FLSSVQCATIRISLPPALNRRQRPAHSTGPRSAGGTAAREVTMSLYPVREVAHFLAACRRIAGADGIHDVTCGIDSSCVEGVPPAAEYEHCTPARAGGPRAIPPTVAKVCGLGLSIPATVPNRESQPDASPQSDRRPRYCCARGPAGRRTGPG